ncbi:DUF982 domain-containing protein [Rhizobium sp. S96]|uniref:DUF982 domain-containing protein n=1 Tax=Rhizobium sp. S96 TaxID=3055140 RepID=UPI0025AB59AD|nr:DUF982 domain-containing protein [Rhizobium sp. S96]MDM9619250.1 DUF982 domain-containing protein [Rhizobium sp. S96]
MPSSNWVTVIVHRHGELHSIGSPQDALLILISDWPNFEGIAYISALEACAGTEGGGVSFPEARAAFLLAAVEAGVYFQAA